MPRYYYESNLFIKHAQGEYDTLMEYIIHSLI